MELRDFIFCDDIREETYNKLSLMGVYGHELIFRERPAENENGQIPHFQLSLLVRINVDPGELGPVDSMRFELFLDGQSLGSSESAGILLTNRTTNMMFQKFFVPVRAGQLSFRIALGRGGQQIFAHYEEVALSLVEGWRGPQA